MGSLDLSEYRAMTLLLISISIVRIAVHSSNACIFITEPTTFCWRENWCTFKSWSTNRWTAHCIRFDVMEFGLRFTAVIDIRSEHTKSSSSIAVIDKKTNDHIQLHLGCYYFELKNTTKYGDSIASFRSE